MSKLGYIHKSYGNGLHLATANTYGYNVLSGSNLPVNALIIASPVDEYNTDLGSYSLIATDYEGSPVRLTYTIKEGSGIEYSDDSLKVKIDNKTVVENNHELTTDIYKLIDNDTIIYEKDELRVNSENLRGVSIEKPGLFKIDGKTIKSSDNKLFVDTEALNYANPEAKNPGIVIGDGNIVSIDTGVISLDQKKFRKASNDEFGVVVGTESMIHCEEGIISVNTEALAVCTNSSFGTVIPDGNSVRLTTETELYVDNNGLVKTTDHNFGVFTYDPETFIMNGKKLVVKNYLAFDNLINEIHKAEVEINKQIADIDYLFEEYKIGIEKPEIYAFYCMDRMTGVTAAPAFLNQKPHQMNTQFISVDFAISTNCPFTISMRYDDNIDPAIQLYTINYDNIFDFKGNDGLLEVYQTTQGKTKPLRFSFICKNYFNNNPEEFSRTARITITVSYADDKSINKSLIYSITRFNSGYNEDIVYDVVNIENANPRI